MSNIIRTFPFFALFPGYFVYHWAVINNWIPLFLGGYINEVSLLIITVFILAFLARKNLLINSITLLDYLFLFFVGYFTFIVIINAVILTAHGVTKNHIGALIQITAIYFTFRFIDTIKIKNSLFFISFFIGLMVIWGSIFYPIDMLVAGNDKLSVANYQSLARTFLISAVFGLFSISNKFIRLLGFSFVIVVIFILGARSELVGLCLFIIFFEISFSKHPIRVLIVFTFIAGLFLGFLFSFVDLLLDLFPSSRVLYLVKLGFSDESIVLRTEAQSIAWKAVIEGPLWGNYGHYEQEFSAGFYAHSWLGVWVDLGLTGLLLYVSLHVLAAYFLFRLFLVKSIRNKIIKSQLACSVGLLAMFTVFNLFAKNFQDNGLALAVGFIASLISRFLYNSNQK